eukprot:CAMPEP_0117760118 /NCGR_PEP_ID=MMETSP0947-20121206/16407_1 /TAXON_ID=44440 /ORGANISM="Chattonella subsalsa, Strain CCMP2191" /LENGTH=255 /DNA_ID=CAMNT_0005580683 /DNA_START=210 /DNA_END=977 /DNA_ORIENTATION=-
MTLSFGRSKSPKVAVLGGSGFVGSRVCEVLAERGCSVTSVSRTGTIPSWAESKDWAEGVSWEQGNVLTDEAKVKALLKGCEAVVSTIGVIGFDNAILETGNGDANEQAVKIAKQAGVKKFVYVSVASAVEDAAGGVLAGYFDGKQRAEKAVKQSYPNEKSLIIKPSFIYGGDSFNVSPPRVPDGYGSFVESALSLGFVRSVASVSPGPLAVALSPPVSVKTVAAAAAAGALGLVQGGKLDGTDDIKEAASMLETS